MRRYLAINFGALVVYIVYPMAPPWMASEDGYIDEAICRGSPAAAGADLGLGRFDLVLQGVGNPVAAMPSLHAGITFLVAMYGIWRLRTPLRLLLVLYPLAMSSRSSTTPSTTSSTCWPARSWPRLVMVGCGLWERRRAGRGPRRPVKLSVGG